ncbi:MAG: hypothetical protein QNJ97_09200 [Myxococcota bacterium]|nr:hypothetical protein [Myxococcota bacterium]
MKKKATKIRKGFYAFISLAIAVIGCAPTVTVRHMDYTYDRVEIYLDNEFAGELEPGQSISQNVSRGIHLIEALPEGERTCPWTEDGSGIYVLVDREAELILLPRYSAAPEEASPTSFREVMKSPY